MGIDSSVVISGASTTDSVVSAATKSAPEPQPAKVQPQPQETQPAPKADVKPLDRVQAEKVASHIQDALNRNDSTEIRFNVSLASSEGKGQNDFTFQVVDKATGKVIRQFPPEDILDVKDKLDADPPQPGVFVDSQA